MCTNPILTLKKDNEILPLRKLKKFELEQYKNAKSEEIVLIKCGKCSECRLEKTLEMRQRIKLELKQHKESYFLTLTYDDEHKKNLNVEDIQKFIKRYRKIKNIRYFYVGELGEKTKRPHYHMIVFGDMPNDLKESQQKTKSNYIQYNSKSIEKLWGMGLIKISKITPELVKYITKYMLKNLGQKDFLCKWSRKPPIGIEPEEIEKSIQKNKYLKALKRYYKNHIGEPLKNKEIEEQAQQKINEIEKQTKMKYFDYIQKKRHLF